MSMNTVQTIIRKAVADAEFRALLMGNPAEALAGYDLTDEEQTHLSRLEPSIFDAAGNELEKRLSRAAGGWDAN
jgi:hypothetical protein